MAQQRTAPKIVLAFDAYGTLLSTQSIADNLTSHFGPDQAQTIATAWRRYQLEYTWRMNSMNQYEPFSTLTLRSLTHALADSHVSLDPEQTELMMGAYDSLACFPDVPELLTTLKNTPDVRAVIFSNGTQKMVASSVANCPYLSAHTECFEEIVSVDRVKKFKPAPEAYRHLAEQVGLDPDDVEQMERLWLVSGNPFDVVGARAVGMSVIWVDRGAGGWRDELVAGVAGRPTEIVGGLGEVVGTVVGV
ncbi:hypothetical protein LTR62_008137 [Meristemomyces frigidus]|uniref:Haloacid dehalogenase n=1 Tax=Meristemomyces frigidus TaxID=1508187 RepID=A0AAN7TB54_9PEZI|nr:hypothetical protein LTR62_008137 [Meristemomyces frigidus]